MIATVFAVSLIFVAVGGTILAMVSDWWFPPLASNWSAIDSTLMVTIVVSGVVFVVLHLILGYAVYRYRHREGQTAAHWHENHRLEQILILATTVGVIVLLAPGLKTYSAYINPPNDALKVDVLGEQWRWSYRLPGADGKLGRMDPKLIHNVDNTFGVDTADPTSHDDVLVQGHQLVLPLDVEANFLIRSKDVLHSFYVPEFRIKMDAVPGIVTQNWAQLTTVGDYQVLCTELCGTNHFLMRSHIRVAPEAEYAAWLDTQPTVAKVFGLASAATAAPATTEPTTAVTEPAAGPADAGTAEDAGE